MDVHAAHEAKELLEVFDEAGNPTGVAKTREEIHRAGDWHLAFFCWVVRSNGDVVLQKRSSAKVTYPGRFDASAAGHVRFGETRAGAMREIEEELGLVVREEELVFLGRHKQEHRHANGIVCREHHDVHLLFRDDPFEAYRPNEEVAGLTAVPTRALEELARGERTELATTLYEGGSYAPRLLRKEDLVPYDATYHAWIAEAAKRLRP